MTCFWDGILAVLGDDDKCRLGLRGAVTHRNLIEALQARNAPTEHLTWQAQVLTSQQVHENWVHVRDYDQAEAPKGYLCSSFEPFLCLLAHLLEKTVHFRFNGFPVTFLPRAAGSSTSIRFACNASHFWACPSAGNS